MSMNVRQILGLYKFLLLRDSVGFFLSRPAVEFVQTRHFLFISDWQVTLFQIKPQGSDLGHQIP